MESVPFVTINDQTLTLEQSLDYLRMAGELPKILVDITRQYLLEQEISVLEIEEPNSEVLEQLILEFRLKQKLTTSELFQLWLVSQNLKYADFRRSIAFRLQVEALKTKVAAPKVQDYFLQRKALLDRIVLSRIVVESAEMAQDLKEKVEQYDADFTQLAKQYACVDDSVVGGVVGAVMRGQIPKPIYEATENAQQGQIVGPIEIEGRYCLLKIEQLLPAKLEGEIKQELENHIFDQWLKEKMKEVKMQLIS